MVKRRLTRLLDEVAETGPIPARSLRDWLLAAVAVVAVLIEVMVDPEQAAVRATVGIGTAALIPWRRQRPLVSLAAALGLHMSLETMARRAALPGDATIGQIFAGMLVVYALCRWDRPNRVLIGMLLLVAAFVGTELLIEYGTDDLSFVVSWMALAVFALAMRYRRVSVDQRHREVRLAERHALARDVHDSVAHHVSAIAVQAQAARYVASTDPEAAVAAMAEVEMAAGRTVDELRRLVGVLRSDDSIGGGPPPESMLDLADPGSRPPVVVRGLLDLTALPPSIAIGIYRIAEEAVTNAKRHSRQATIIDVHLRRDGERLVLDVTDDGVAMGVAGTGYGLIGMRERAVVLGGSVTTGPQPMGGWRVVVVVPLRLSGDGDRATRSGEDGTGGDIVTKRGEEST